MPFSKNNLLIFRGPLSTLGGLATPGAVMGALAQFDVVVAALPLAAGSEMNFLKSMAAAYRVDNPIGKFFGYTSLGTSLDLPAWEAQVDAWKAAIGSALAGVFIDDFGFEHPLCSRDNQNAAVAYAHANGLAVFVRASNMVDVFDRVSDATDFVIGRDTTLTDIVAIPDFYQRNEDAVQPTAEGPEGVIGRMKFSQGVRTDAQATPPVKLNLEFAAIVGAGQQTEVSFKNVWQLAANAAAGHGVEYLALVPFGEGTDAPIYFLRNQANTFVFGEP
jgi:hypothetical protein